MVINKMVEGMDLTIENLKVQLNEIKQKISQCRKRGLYTKIVELKIMSVPSKIQLLEATRDFRDVQKANNIINDARNEIEFIEKQGLNSGDEVNVSKLEEATKIIEEIDNLLKENKIKEAKDSYLKCTDIYKSLPQENKKEILGRLNELRIRINRG